MKTIILLLAFSGFIFAEEKARFDNFQVFRVLPKTRENVKFLKNLEDTLSNFNFWTSARAVNEYVDVMVSPNEAQEFEDLIRAHNMDLKVFIPNVQKLIDNERAKDKRVGDFGWTDYYTLDEINAWLTSLIDKYPGIVTLEKAGSTYEGRDILGVRLTFAPGNRKKSVFIEGNIHAREWITSAVVTYFIDQLLTSTDLRVRQIADSHEWYIFPVANPDGFSFSHTDHRLWRKTRRPYENYCYGADANRNWGYHYNEGGTSDFTCNYNYRGSAAFSENCTKILSEYIADIGSDLEAYIAFHSYAQTLLIPYGYTADHLDNYDELYTVGLKAAEALKSHYGTEYRVGDVVDIMYVASGNSVDWVKGTLGTRITYTYELRDRGDFGFLLPANQIIPTAEETFDSMITIFDEFQKLPSNK